MTEDRIQAVTRFGRALAMIGAPLLLAVGLVVHPLEKQTGAEQLRVVADEATAWDLAHCLILVSMVLFLPAATGLRDLTRGRAGWLGLIGGALVAVGAVFFGALVGVEALATSAFATLPADQREALAPGVQALIDLKGAASVTLLGPLAIVVGLAVLGAGLWGTRSTPRWAGPVTLAGALILLILFLAEASTRALTVGAVVVLVGMAGAAIPVLGWGGGAERAPIGSGPRPAAR